jgi:hypothetical protein
MLPRRPRGARHLGQLGVEAPEVAQELGGQLLAGTGDGTGGLQALEQALHFVVAQEGVPEAAAPSAKAWAQSCFASQAKSSGEGGEA